MDSEEVEFLKDQVQRLNAELSKYVQQPGAEEPEGPLAEEGIPAQWLTDPGVLSPLIAEYDKQIFQLEQQLEMYREEIEKLRPELNRLMSENDRLIQQAKEKLENQFEGVGDGDDEEFHPTTDNEQVLKNLQLQADSALQEKEAAIDRWQESEHEIDRLQRELQNEKDSHQWRVVEHQAQKGPKGNNGRLKVMETEYYETVNALNKELIDAQQELRLTRQELETSKLHSNDIKKTNKSLEQQLQWKDQEIADILFKEGVSDSRITEMKKIMDNALEKLSSSNKELDDVKQDKEGLEARIKEMQKRSSELEQKELDAVTQVRDAVQLAENAVLEKEQAEMDVKQKEEEVDKLQEVINKLINEAGLRTRQEVDNIRQQSNDRITKLTEELHRMEMENAEKQEQLQRAIREKRLVETELEKVYKETAEQVSKEKESYEDLNRRAIIAERSRDESDTKIDAMQSALRREEMNNNQIRTQCDAQLDQMKQRMHHMEQEFELLNDDRVRLQKEVDDMKKTVSSAQKEKEGALRKYQKEMTILENDSQQKIQDYEVRIQSTEDSSRHAVGELRKLLTAQQRMCARWKEECQTITQKFEAKINDVRNELSHTRKRNEELTSLLKESQHKTLEAERMITDYAKNIQRMESRMRESEVRASEASKQLARQTARQRQIQSERRSLIDELQRSNVESPNRSVRHTEALVIGDLSTSRRSVADKSLTNGTKVKDIDDVLSDR